MLPTETGDFAITGKQNFQHYLCLKWTHTGRNKERRNNGREGRRKEREREREGGREGQSKLKQSFIMHE